MSLTIGTQLGSFVVTALLGKGGMGEVYRARDRKLKREVAIKVLSDELSRSDDRVLRFQQEAEVLASLNHPNIAAIHDLQEEGNVRFLILELVEGVTLDDALKRGVLSLDETLNIARQIADALEAAHGKGVIHRDLKTANIKLTPEGRVKVLDFGLAKAMRNPEMAFSNAETAAGMTGAGTILGTLAYMSPEQVRGESLDERSDIFSFGIVLYEMIAGRHPFAANTAADTIAAILTSRPLAIADADALPVALRQVVSKCLEKDKTKRYQKAPEIVVQLKGIRRLEGLPIQTGAGAPILLPPVLARTTDSTAFFGRENERRSMVEAWDGSKNGKRRVILVGGEPGIGKTRLCAEFARQCGEEGAIVLLGRSDEHALIPYQPFIEALSWYVRMCPEADLLAHLSAIGGGAELGPLLPELVRRVPELPVLAPMNPEGQRFRLFEAVSALMAAMSASRPTLVVFDDLHWADQPSLLMLRHIARSSESARLCLVGNYRESEVTLRHPLAEMLADLRSHPWVTRIVLPGLSATQVSDLVGSFAGSDTPRSLVQAVAENSGGNPFFIGEILRHLMETGAFAVLRDASAVRSSDLGVPDGVRDVIRQRLSRLSEDCNRMLTLAAMIGQEFNLTLIETLSGLSEDRLLEVIEEAIRAQLIAEVREGRDRCRFVHALIRETLYEELSGPRRSRWHRKIGEAIEQLTHDPPLADLAYHFAEAAGTGVIDKAVDYAIRAGDHAAGTLAHEEAARFYEMALRALEAAPAGPETAARRLDIHTRRGRVFAAIAQWLPAKQEFERALETASEEQIDRRCELLLGIFESSFWLGHEVAAVERIALDALSLAERLPDRGDLAADAMAGSARCKIVSGDIPGAIALNRRAILSAGGHRTMAHAFGPLPLYLAGQSAEAVAIGTEAARIAHTSRDTSFTIFALPHFAISLAAVGRYGEAKDVFKEARAFGRRYGVVGPLARVISFESGLHLSIFDFKGAEELQRESRELAGGAGFLQPFISSGIDMLLTFARNGNPGPAEVLMKETASAAATNPWHKNLWKVRLSQARAELALARGDRNTTIEEAITAIEQARALGRPKYEALAHIARAHALGGLDRMPEAIADANRAIALARRTADPALLLQALDVLLMLDGNDEALTEARALVGRIVSALPNDTMLQSFQASETVSRVQKL